MEPETNKWWWLDIDKLASVAGEIMAQMRESGACSACKLAVQYAEETYMSEAADLKSEEEVKEYMKEVRAIVCKEVFSKDLVKKISGKDEDFCPLTVDSVESIVEAAAMKKKELLSESTDGEKVSSSYSNEVQCPIEELCKSGSTQISDIVDTVNSYMCKAVNGLADWLNKGQDGIVADDMDSEEEWEMMEGKIKEMGAQLSPIYEEKMNQVLKHAELMKKQAPDMEANERFMYYKQIVLESLKSEIPMFQKCFEE